MQCPCEGGPADFKTAMRDYKDGVDGHYRPRFCSPSRRCKPHVRSRLHVSRFGLLRLPQRQYHQPGLQLMSLGVPHCPESCSSALHALRSSKSFCAMVGVGGWRFNARGGRSTPLPAPQGFPQKARAHGSSSTLQALKSSASFCAIPSWSGGRSMEGGSTSLRAPKGSPNKHGLMAERCKYGSYTIQENHCKSPCGTSCGYRSFGKTNPLVCPPDPHR